MRHSKLFSILSLVCMLALLLCSCKPEGNQPASADDDASPKKESSAISELNYFYIDYLNALSQDWYAMHLLNQDGYNPSLPADEQLYKEDPNKTWADHFLAEAQKEYCAVNALCEEAAKANYTLPAEKQAEVAATLANLQEQASMHGYSSVAQYLCALYGGRTGYRIDMDTFDSDCEALLEVAKANNHYTIDDDFYTLCSIDSVYTAQEIAYYAEKFGCKDVRDIASLVKKLDTSLDEAAFLYDYELTLAWAEQEGTYDPEALMEKITDPGSPGHPIYNSSLNIPDGLTYYTLLLFAQDLKDLRDLPDHLFRSPLNICEETYTAYVEKVALAQSYLEHYKNSLTYTPNQIEDFAKAKDTYDGLTDQQLVSIRHILISYEGGIYDEETFTTVYTAAEKKAAADKIAKIKAEWESGKKTGESFGALAKKYTDADNGEQGGLYENIYPGWAIEELDAWCFDESRKPGDVDIISTEFGCHLVYFVGTQDQTHRNYVITCDMRDEDANAWRDALAESWAASHNIPDTSPLNTSMVLSPE